MGHAGDAIRVMREAQGLSARELARLAKVSDGYLHDVEAGQISPTENWLERVKAALAANLPGGRS